MDNESESKQLRNLFKVVSPQTMVTNLLEHQQLTSPDYNNANKSLFTTSIVPYNYNEKTLTRYQDSRCKTISNTNSKNVALIPKYLNIYCPTCGRSMPRKFHLSPNKSSKSYSNHESNGFRDFRTYLYTADSKMRNKVNSSDISNDKYEPNYPKTNTDVNEKDLRSVNDRCIINYNVENQNYFFFLEELYRQINIRSNINRIPFTVTNNYSNFSSESQNSGENEELKSLEFNSIKTSEVAEKDINHLINLNSDILMTGYYDKFFVEIKRLGSGSFGQVYLCAHVLDGITLAKYAIKKVPVGDDKKWLSIVLREVKIRELLHHPNIVQYRHSWLEMYSSNDFCPKVPWLFQLMEYCNSGSLEALVPTNLNSLSEIKKKRVAKQAKDLSLLFLENNHEYPFSCEPTSEESNQSRITRENCDGYYSGEYIHDNHIWKLFFDIILGLQHLHHRGILHRDLKPSNILLHITFDEFLSQPICQALLSDFGTAQILKGGNSKIISSEFIADVPSNPIETQNNSTEAQYENVMLMNQRHGFTGTIEYTAPELLTKDSCGNFIGEYNLYSDIWSLGITIYNLCYNQVPFRVDSSNGLDPDDPEECIRAIFTGMNNLQFPSQPNRSSELKLLIRSLLEPNPNDRPNTDDILRHPVIQEKLRSSELLVNASIELAKIIKSRTSGH
ncbi:wee kinase [Cryptosporidium felis]|nr:wee kinase [Cryptosporidium felis]